MSDTSLIDDDDDDFTLGGTDGEGDEGQGADADEGEVDEVEEGGEDPEDDGREAGEEGLSRPRQGRTSNSVRRAKAAAKEANERAARFERELDDLRRQVQQPIQPRLTQADIDRLEREEDERLSLMSPAEQARYIRQQMRQEFQGQLQNERMQMREDLDRRSFDQMAASNKLAANYKDRVEDLVRQRRAAGEFVTRDIALAFLIGQDALKRASGTDVRRQRQQARSRVNGATTRPTRGSGSQPSERGSRRGDGESFEELAARIANTRF